MGGFFILFFSKVPVYNDRVAILFTLVPCAMTAIDTGRIVGRYRYVGRYIIKPTSGFLSIGIDKKAKFENFQSEKILREADAKEGRKGEKHIVERRLLKR